MTPKTRKIRHTPSRSSASIRQRKTHAHTRSLPHHLTRSASPASHSLLHPAPEFNFTSAEPMDEDEDDDDENVRIGCTPKSVGTLTVNVIDGVVRYWRQTITAD